MIAGDPLLLLSPPVRALTGGLLGLIAGSFLATLVRRWPEGRSVARGRSACDGCGTPLGAMELVPLASWLVLRGRCRRCGARIDPIHPLMEAGGAATGALALAWVPGWPGAAGALFGWMLLALLMLDLRHFWLPDLLTLPLLAAGLAIGPAPLLNRVIGAAAGYALLRLVAWAYRAARGRDGLGGGDAKLFAAIGAWLGWVALAPVLLVASLGGLAAAAAMAAAGRAVAGTTRLPFGALLAPAGFLLWLWPR